MIIRGEAALGELCPKQLPGAPKTNKWWSVDLQDFRDKVKKAGRKRNRHQDIHKKFMEAMSEYTKGVYNYKAKQQARGTSAQRQNNSSPK